VTPTEIALIVTASGTFMSSLVAAIGAIISMGNSRKLDEVHKTTNSLAARNEAIAKQLGIQEGIEKQKANPT
jgi:hypothetical protein